MSISKNAMVTFSSILFLMVLVSNGNAVEKDPGPPLVMGVDGFPSNVIEVAPTRTAAFEIFPSGKRFIWVAVNTRTVKPSRWAWKRYGPYDFKEKTRYYSHIGQIDFTVAPDYDARHSKLMRGESGLSFENIYGDKWVAFVIGDLLNASTTDHPNVSGIWTTNFGEMVIEVKDGQVTGTYTRDNGAIKGRIEGSKVAGTWSEAPTYHGPEDAGDFEWVLDADGKSFRGQYRYEGSTKWNGPWEGKRLGTTPAAKSPQTVDVSGTWEILNAGSDGRNYVNVSTAGGQFRATCSYTVKGIPYSWTMTATMTPDGKVVGQQIHSAMPNPIPRVMQLSPDGTKFTGTFGTWVRP